LNHCQCQPDSEMHWHCQWHGGKLSFKLKFKFYAASGMPVHYSASMILKFAQPASVAASGQLPSQVQVQVGPTPTQAASGSVSRGLGAESESEATFKVESQPAPGPPLPLAVPVPVCSSATQALRVRL